MVEDSAWWLESPLVGLLIKDKKHEMKKMKDERKEFWIIKFSE